MAGRRSNGLCEAMRCLNLGLSQGTRRWTAPSQRCELFYARGLATEAPLRAKEPTPFMPISTVPVTLHSFPAFEPLSVRQYSARHLYLPLRRDILHRAVVYEGDNTRQGTASSKTAWQVAGSHRKLRPQKGLGRARVGWRQSPTRVGGGKAFGPHPRDFGTDLPRKVYDRAWRTALSYRYRRGELLVCEGDVELPLSDDFYRLAARGLIKGELHNGYMAKQGKQLAGTIRSIAGERAGSGVRTLFVTAVRRGALFEAMEQAGKHGGRALEVGDVDVKDLLEDGRVVVERAALDEMLRRHQSDLGVKLAMGAIGYPRVGDVDEGMDEGVDEDIIEDVVDETNQKTS